MIRIERWDCLACHLVMLPRRWQGRLYCSECSSAFIRPHLGIKVYDTRILASMVTGA